MKTVKFLIVSLAILMAAFSSAMDNARYAITYNFKDKQSEGVLGYKIASVEHIFGLPVRAEAWGLASYGFASNTGQIGGAGVLRFPFDPKNPEGAAFYAGGTIKGWDKQPSFGLILGISF
jgi:hypothetical protein